MRYEIPSGNWPTFLAKACEGAKRGDVIEVASWHAAQLGHSAATRFHGADHGIVFEVDGKPVAQSDADEPPGEDGAFV